MKNNYGKPQRVDKEWIKIARETMKERYDRGLAKFNSKELGLAEYTRLQMRAPSFKKLIEELKTLPKRENVKF